MHVLQARTREDSCLRSLRQRCRHVHCIESFGGRPRGHRFRRGACVCQFKGDTSLIAALRHLRIGALVLGVLAMLLAPVTATTAAPATMVAPQAIGSPPPDNYVPQMGLLFNHPYRSDRGQILRHVLRMINSTEAGHSIKIAAFGINHRGVVDGLIAARNRGVSVKVIGDAHLIKRSHRLYSGLFVKLRRSLGHDRSASSYAMVCGSSCRGYGGNFHQKFFMFDMVGGVPWIVTQASGNLTQMAVGGQWNHAKTVSDAATYNNYNVLFEELALDRPSATLPMQFTSIPLGDAWVFPYPGMGMETDPVGNALKLVQCKIDQPDGSFIRTKIRVGMYAWFGRRGERLGRQLRGLWNDGCDVAVEVAVTSKSMKYILRSRSGRGPIPGKLVATYDSTGMIKSYLHSKYVTIQGGYDGATDASIVISGTCNFTDLGTFSDEFTSIYSSAEDVIAYNDDFDAVWRERQAKNWRESAARELELEEPVLGSGKLKWADQD